MTGLYGMRIEKMKWSEFAAVLTWISGVVLAKSGWSTFFAIVFPPWAFYVVIEVVLKAWGVL
jgi:hypothetical protein